MRSPEAQNRYVETSRFPRIRSQLAGCRGCLPRMRFGAGSGEGEWRTPRIHLSLSCNHENFDARGRAPVNPASSVEKLGTKASELAATDVIVRFCRDQRQQPQISFKLSPAWQRGCFFSTGEHRGGCAWTKDSVHNARHETGSIGTNKMTGLALQTANRASKPSCRYLFDQGLGGAAGRETANHVGPSSSLAHVCFCVPDLPQHLPLPCRDHRRMCKRESCHPFSDHHSMDLSAGTQASRLSRCSRLHANKRHTQIATHDLPKS
ncbi:uncharacterized protein B0H64DRAFT_90299 [Chaetomium fimeti]|uniref:Uncharacterized protein n=1 Tax=Chaetomium fimeti TaxID=1854472 RepID=A0AAE0HM43_9PEZI|nr:hypothetical protein B0H64DRAFT_90299 [Chaetomium fimeti]